jgi:hypothetical protein
MTAAAPTVAATITQLAAAAADSPGLCIVARRADGRYHPWRECPACAMAHDCGGVGTGHRVCVEPCHVPRPWWNAVLPAPSRARAEPRLPSPARDRRRSTDSGNALLQGRLADSWTEPRTGNPERPARSEHCWPRALRSVQVARLSRSKIGFGGDLQLPGARRRAHIR